MKLIMENWRRFNEQDEERLGLKYKVYKQGKYDPWLARISAIEKIFKYFHLSSKRLGKTKTFNPRVPARPWEDDDGNKTEDDFSKRISVAPSIALAAKALGDPDYYEVYAVDFLDIPTDDVEVFDLQARFKHCPDSPGNKYGQRFNLRKWLDRRAPDEEPDYVDSRGYGPVDLPPKLRQQFYGCVPDAMQTGEKWITKNVKMFHLGQSDLDDPWIALTHEAAKLIDRYLKALG